MQSEKLTYAKQSKRALRMQALASSLTKATKHIFNKRGFENGAIIQNWRLIAGSSIADISQPERIVHQKGHSNNATLYLRIQNSALSTEIQHLQPQILDRINTYFGFKAITSLKLIHRPITIIKTKNKPYPPINKQEKKCLDSELANIKDDDLRYALEKLGEAILKRSK